MVLVNYISDYRYCVIQQFLKQKQVMERAFPKILPILLLKLSKRATGDMPNWLVFDISSSKNSSRTLKNSKAFFVVLENILLCFINAKFDGNSSQNNKVTAIHTLGTLNISLILFSMTFHCGHGLATQGPSCLVQKGWLVDTQVCHSIQNQKVLYQY